MSGSHEFLVQPHSSCFRPRLFVSQCLACHSGMEAGQNHDIVVVAVSNAAKRDEKLVLAWSILQNWMQLASVHVGVERDSIGKGRKDNWAVLGQLHLKKPTEELAGDGNGRKFVMHKCLYILFLKEIWSPAQRKNKKMAYEIAKRALVHWIEVKNAGWCLKWLIINFTSSFYYKQKRGLLDKNSVDRIIR